jgi:hypothetical protein
MRSFRRVVSFCRTAMHCSSSAVADLRHEVHLELRDVGFAAQEDEREDDARDGTADEREHEDPEEDVQVRLVEHEHQAADDQQQRRGHRHEPDEEDDDAAEPTPLRG